MPSRYRFLLAVMALGLATAPAHAALTAGAGKATIDLSADLLPIDDFTAVLDPLAVRVVVLADGPGRAAITVVDQTSLSASDVARMKDIVARATDTPADHVLIVASHTFSAPHMFAGSANPPPGMATSPEEVARAKLYVARVMAALTRAAQQAAAGRAPATLSFGTTTSAVNINRNVDMAQGWWLGASEAGYSDKTLALLRIDGADHRPIATLINYPVQSSIMDHTGGEHGTKAVTADLGGAAAAHVEDHLGGVSLFLTGAAGDQVPAYTALHNVYDAKGQPVSVNLGAGGYPLVALEGERLGAAAMRAATLHAAGPLRGGLAVVSGTVTLTTQERPRQLTQIRPTRSYAYKVTGTAEAPYTILVLGDVAIVGVQVELNAATGAWIRAHSPFAHTIVATMVNGAAKYLPDAQGYKDMTYEAMNASYGPGSGEVFARAIVARLAALAPARRR
jgi:neutral ceramidase